ncbi:hypothetical protein BT96DRAFT_988883 [Gymnopus androsaceus JB14]|uniref:Uncharacterized protein n=1 Tax=Gymnopus androsaceus JB14 TaxID=1447944 RepID=A0A6A4I561_9AGAR|nr:hypothetical protein BT96DRAFT_988883 [Gymnopus androsaceus JB14]
MAVPAWSGKTWGEFHAGILCLIALGCLSFKFVNNPKWNHFTHKWIPGAPIVDQRILSGPILTAEVKHITAATREVIGGQFTMYQADNWKNIAKTSVITSMLIVNHKPYLLQTHDMNGRPKKGDTLWAIDSLVTGNLLAADSTVTELVSRSIDIVKFFNNHGGALDKLKLTQSLHSPGTKPILLFLPAATWWTWHYCSVCAGKECKQTENAEKVIDLVLNQGFWCYLRRIWDYLDPLALAANILQALNCSFDKVILMLGNLFHFYSHIPDEDEVIHNANKVFNKTKISHTDLWHITCCTFLWFTGEQANLEFLQAFDDYILNRGSFSDATMCTAEFKQMADNKGCIVDLLGLWCHQGATNVNGHSGLVGIALCILQMIGNSASTECTFSVFGLTHSNIRNWLAPDTVHDLTMVRMDCHHERKAAGVVYTHKKHKFGDSEPEAEPTAEQEDDTVSSISDVFFSLVVTATDDNEDDDSNNDVQKIALEYLFAYPSATDMHQAFHFYQAHRRASLDVEEEEVAGMFTNNT